MGEGTLIILFIAGFFILLYTVIAIFFVAKVTHELTRIADAITGEKEDEE